MNNKKKRIMNRGENGIGVGGSVMAGEKTWLRPTFISLFEKKFGYWNDQSDSESGQEHGMDGRTNALTMVVVVGFTCGLTTPSSPHTSSAHQHTQKKSQQSKKKKTSREPSLPPFRPFRIQTSISIVSSIHPSASG